SAEVSGAHAPTSLSLSGGSPNPFRNMSTIAYSLPARTDVELRVVDVRGRLVRILDSGPRQAGEHRVDWNGRDRGNEPVSPGIYFLELRAGGQKLTQKIVRVVGD